MNVPPMGDLLDQVQIFGPVSLSLVIEVASYIASKNYAINSFISGGMSHMRSIFASNEHHELLALSQRCSMYVMPSFPKRKAMVLSVFAPMLENGWR